MKQKIVFYSVILFIFSSNLFAESETSFQCTYAEGNILFGKSGAWQELNTGRSVGEDDFLRLDSNSIVTLKEGSRQITISSPGTYNMEEISLEIPQRQKISLIDTFLTKLKNILNPETVISSQALGVRAAEVEDAGFEWTDTDEDDFEYALELLEEGDLGEAEYLLEDLIDFGNPYQIDEYRFYLAYSKILQENHGEALKQLNLIEDASIFPFYEGFLVLFGRLSYESMNDQKAKEIWEEYMLEFPEGYAADEARQYLRNIR
ncbi:MAG: hypothetical protein JEY99_03785 [Spirochaetales bacterium]|nr:hypothetical protein [Spirochaetales bacterium]